MLSQQPFHRGGDAVAVQPIVPPQPLLVANGRHILVRNGQTPEACPPGLAVHQDFRHR